MRPHRAGRPQPADGVAPPQGPHRRRASSTRTKRGTWAYYKLVPGALDRSRSCSSRREPGASRARSAAEFLGSALLAAVVIGSGIAAQRLSPDDVGLQLLENAFATALGLAVLILVFADRVAAPTSTPSSRSSTPCSHRKGVGDTARLHPGADPRMHRRGDPREPDVRRARRHLEHDRSATWPHLLAEVVATAGLVAGDLRARPHRPRPPRRPAVGAYIGAAYFFTSSTSFANPAITIGRMFSDTFAGIAPASVLPFIAAQLVGRRSAGRSSGLLPGRAPASAAHAKG